MDLRLRPLEAEEFPRFRELLRREYVRSLTEEAGLGREAAEAKASADHEVLFAGGRPQPHHRIYILEDPESGAPVGHLFWSPRRPPGSTTDRAYLYELFIDEEFRRQGLGKLALELLESEARAEGLPGIDLNVWGGNDAARALYRTAGFREHAVFMSKELA
jgi:ribosomal protein S18 acetylase RimI-like enzyme